MTEGSAEEDKRRRPSPPPVEFVRQAEESPFPPRDQPPAAWVPRPEDYQPGPARRPPQEGAPEPSNLPKIAGVLLLLSAGLGMAAALYNVLLLPSPEEYANFTQNNSPVELAFLQICGLISIWGQAMALLGGIMAFQRMNWKLTAVCAVASLATLGFYFEASLVGVIALFVTMRARPYFFS